MTTYDNTIMPDIPPVSFACPTRVSFHPKDIEPLLSKIRPSFHVGPYCLPQVRLKIGSAYIPILLFNLFNVFLNSGTLPHQWKLLPLSQLRKLSESMSHLNTDPANITAGCLRYYGKNNKKQVINLIVTPCFQEHRPIWVSPK